MTITTNVLFAAALCAIGLSLTPSASYAKTQCPPTQAQIASCQANCSAIENPQIAQVEANGNAVCGAQNASNTSCWAGFAAQEFALAEALSQCDENCTQCSN